MNSEHDSMANERSQDESDDTLASGDGRVSEDRTVDGGASMLEPRSSDSATTVASGGGGDRRAGVERPGAVIGRYKLLSALGEGGFGVVYMAEQREPVQRNVALKIVKLGMDTKQVIARFEQERQALALMDHPNIAKVLDAGATDTGRPYFVMELVKGVPITEYCNRQNMSFAERLKLFAQVCGAVQHAHQKGIIHRDIKPSNVLVTHVDDKPAPKVIDFGIAKATQARLTEQTMFTEIGQFIGTPAYMSPEQADPLRIDIDTRSDVYSLGVLLYELLTGATPFDGKSLRRAGLDEIKRIIREEDPPRPSTRLSNLGGELDTVARQRSVEPKKLRSSLRGDLDWIIMKALEKDRARRYETANGLAMDIGRFLGGEPVVAAPPSTSYRFWKFARRHRGAVAAGLAVAASLVLGIIAFAWQASITRIERDRAIAAEAETKLRAEELKKVADFQGQMLSQVDPAAAGLRLTADVRSRFDAALAKAGVAEDERVGRGDSFASEWSRVNATDAARELIDSVILSPAVAAIETQFADQPVVASNLREALANQYYRLGLTETALSLGRQVLTDRRRVLGDEHPDTLVILGSVGAYLSALGRYIEAEPYYVDALKKNRRVRGTDDQETLVSEFNLGSLLRLMGRLSEAEPYYRAALEKRQRVLGDGHPDTLASIAGWAKLLQDRGEPLEAEPFSRLVYEKRLKSLGHVHPDTLTAMNNLAGNLWELRNWDEAIAISREATARRRRVLGEVHPQTLNSIKNLGTMLGRSGHDAEAESLMREALSNQTRLLGADHPDTLVSLSNLAVFLLDCERLQEAEPMCREALERRRRVLGEDHPDTLVANNVMGYVLRSQERNGAAEPYVRQTLAISRRVLGPLHPDTILYAHNLAMLLDDQDKVEEAEMLLREVVDAGGPAIGEDKPVILSAALHLGEMLLMQKRYADAAELLTKAEPAARAGFTGTAEDRMADFLKNQGIAYARIHDFAGGEMCLLEAHGTYSAILGAAHQRTIRCGRVVVSFYVLWDESEPGRGHDATSAEWRVKLDALEAASQPAKR